MLKTNTSIQEKIVFTVACFIASCVFMLSVHAKDIVHYTDATTAAQIGYHDITAKAASELHDHVDKQIVKTFDSSAGSDHFIVNARPKQDLDALNEEDPGLWGRLHETLLMWGVYASLPFSLA